MERSSGVLTSTASSLNPFWKASKTRLSCCFSMIPGVVANTRNAQSRFSGSGAWLSWKRALSSSGHGSSAHDACQRFWPPFYTRDSHILAVGLTVFCVLPSNFCHSMADLVTDVSVGLGTEGLK